MCGRQQRWREWPAGWQAGRPGHHQFAGAVRLFDRAGEACTAGVRDCAAGTLVHWHTGCTQRALTVPRYCSMEPSATDGEEEGSALAASPGGSEPRLEARVMPPDRGGPPSGGVRACAGCGGTGACAGCVAADRGGGLWRRVGQVDGGPDGMVASCLALQVATSCQQHF